ncbi:hypothetical protein VC83_04426 [Pseudogymnoascus destructans]|uniref:Uncharacterized protein n=2 Tax=Pseudogymnoascus destructans TaxID=655981 RepID=L8FY56_PSED2|nr:uncharacterized protein VC83_04426 [Pseudogymnoascus destructans]ELR05797.1 hypothetical protein GMDG_01875 [Pseudogymnoascus destructans 20631-21]OAF59429.1 hypothetical protein VC83_04426 [Pseudogymnoascus destructans]
MAPSIYSSMRQDVDIMVPSRYLPQNNPLLVCDPEPHGWARKDPIAHSDYVSMEELVTYNNFRLAKYREEHSVNNLNNLEAETATNIRTVPEAAEDRKIASRRADIVRAIRGQASPRKNPYPESFTKRRNVQGLRNRATYFAKKECWEECQRDSWLQQDAISWEQSINKALPQTPPLSLHQQSKSEESRVLRVASSIYSDDSYLSSRHGHGNNNQDDLSMNASASESCAESADGYPNSPPPSHSHSSRMEQTEDSSSSPPEISDPNYQINEGLLEELKNHYLKPRNKISHEESTSCKPATTQKVSNFLYRSNSLPVNITPMSERQKTRLEIFRESAPTNGTSQVDRLPHHVAITRPRASGLLSPAINAKELHPAADQLTGIHQPAIRRPEVAIVTYGNDENNHGTAHTNGYQSEGNGPRNFRQRTVSTDYPEDRSTSTLGGDYFASSDDDPLEAQGVADSPLKKIFGDGGSFDQLKADTKPVLKSMWGSVKAKVHITKPKMGMSAFKEMFSLRSQDPNLGMVTSNFMISCDQEFQSSLYASLDLLICTVANKFLLFEHFEDRVTPVMAAQYIEKWVKLGRAQFTEFNCGQPFQALIIWECRESLQFYGDHEARVRNAALDTWLKNANSMSVLTRCNGDSAIQKHMHDSWKVLEILGGTWDNYDSLSRLHISFHDVVAGAKTRNDALGIEHDWNPPPVPPTPAMASIKSPDLSHLYRQG